MERKFPAIALILTLCFSFALSGCTKLSEGTNGGTVKVGWIGSLTGDQAVWGQCESNTVKMMFEDVNKSGGLLGKKIEVIAYDTRGDAQEAVNAVKRLTGQDKVVAIIGPNASGQAIPISAVL